MDKKTNWAVIIHEAVLTVGDRCRTLNDYIPTYISLSKIIDAIKQERRWMSKHQIEVCVRNHIKTSRVFGFHTRQGETFIYGIPFRMAFRPGRTI